jgi:hypothetical protein
MKKKSAVTTVDPNLHLIFKGLCAFAFSKKIVHGPAQPDTECQVGILSAAPGHQLKITIVKEEGESREISSFNISPSVGQLFKFITLSTADDRGVTCYKDDATLNDPRLRRPRPTPPSGVGKHDFRWIADLEGVEFHNSKLTLLEKIFLPIIKIKTGEFYTRRVTDEFFVQVQNRRIIRPFFGNTAEEIGTEIAVAPDSGFTLKLADMPIVSETAMGTKKYRISFENSCPTRKDPPSATLNAFLKDGSVILELQGWKDLLVKSSIDAGATAVAVDPPLTDEAAEEVLTRQPTDIQYYYYGINKPPLEWFDLREPGRGVRPAICYPMLFGENTGLPTT